MTLRFELVEEITTRVSRGFTDGVEVALKRLPGLNDHTLQAEIDLYARLEGSTAVPRVVASSSLLGERFLATEWIEGARPLLVERSGPPARLPAPEPSRVHEAVARGVALLRALDEIHRAGVRHGDLRPEHVLVDPMGEVHIVGFNVAARASKGGMAMGNLRYVSPEQAIGEQSGPPADLYLAGVLLFEMATGSHPFYAESDFGFAHQHTNVLPPIPRELNPAIGSSLDGLIRGLLAKDPSRRPSLAEARARLQEILVEQEE